MKNMKSMKASEEKAAQTIFQALNVKFIKNPCLMPESFI